MSSKKAAKRNKKKGNKGEAKAMAGWVNNILSIRSLMLFNGTGKQAVAVDQKMDNL